MRQRARSLLLCIPALLWTTGLGAVARDDDGAGLIEQPIRTHYDGVTDDLLTAGLGRTGL